MQCDMAMWVNVHKFVAAGSIRLCAASNNMACSDVTEILENVSEAVDIAIRWKRAGEKS